MQAIAFPFRFRRNRAVTLDSADERYAAQKILTAASTRIGELSLRPRFGTQDPEFAEFDRAGFYYTCATFFPEIEITSLEERVDATGRGVIDVAFSILTEETNLNALT